jgi:small-conductance mechanosensitive channel
MDKAELLVQHYQDTYQLTYQLWQQRNRLFLFLLGIVALASLLTYAPETNSIFLSWIGKVVGISDKKALIASVPFALLQAAFLAVVFYLMVNLFHRALYILRNYRYLGALETEIRTTLQLNESDLAFTRESSFYWSDRPWVLGTVKYVYIVFLGVLMLAFLGGRIHTDWGNWLLIIVDIGLAVPTLGYFFAFSYYSIGLDQEQQ